MDLQSQFIDNIYNDTPDKFFQIDKFTKDCGVSTIHKLVFFPNLLEEYLLECKYGDALLLTTEDNLTPLHIALSNGIVKSIELLIESTKKCKRNLLSLVNFKDGNKLISISWYFIAFKDILNHALIYGCNIDIIKLFPRDVLSHLVNVQDDFGKTALHYSVLNTDEKVVEYLLSFESIDVNIQDNDGYPVISRTTNPAILKLLLSRPEIDVNLKHRNGDTTLNYWSDICENVKDINAIKMLLDHPDTDVNLQNDDGDSPIMNSSSLTVTKLLLEHPKLNVNLQNDRGMTILMMDSIAGNDMTVKRILSRDDIDVNLQDNDGYTALMYAGEQGNYDIVKMLLVREDIDVNKTNIDGNTARQLIEDEDIRNLFPLSIKCPYCRTINSDTTEEIQSKIGEEECGVCYENKSLVYLNKCNHKICNTCYDKLK